MLEFETVKIEDKAWYGELTAKANREQPRINLDASFGADYIWGEYYGTRICRFEDFIVKGYFDDDGTASFSFPLGTGNVEKAIKAIEKYTLEKNIPLYFGGVTKQQADIINSIYGGRFEFAKNRDYFEYIYETEKLATLAGRKLHSKRNHINRFEASYNYTFEPINSENINDAFTVSDEWYNENSGAESLDYERAAIKKSIDNFDILNFKGAVIKIDGKPVAMTMGEPISDKAFVVHFEKALSGYEGLYVAINCYFARTLTDYLYINREEDMGIEGLRRAKLSYKPAILLEQYEGRLNG